MKKTVIISLLVVLCAVSTRAQQIYNMDFDDWSKESGTWYARMKDAPASTGRYMWERKESFCWAPADAKPQIASRQIINRFILYCILP